MQPVFAFPFLVRLRDHGAWPGISQYSISHVAFLSRIFISHVAFLSRIFISHLAFLSRMSHFFLAFLSHISYFYLASRIFISHFYLASRIFISHFTPEFFFLLLLSRISNVPYRLPYIWADALIIQAVADALKVTIQIVESKQGFAPLTTVYPVQERNTLSTITIGHIDVYQLYITMYQPLPYNQMCPFQCAVN